MARASIKNLDKALAKMKALGPAIDVEARREMEAHAEDIVTAMKSRIPVKSGALQRSAGWTWGAPPVGTMATSTNREDTITIYAGGRNAFWARWIEFGTRKMPAQPFFFSSWRAGRKKVKGRMRNAAKKAVSKVAA
jgi:HK97 gp10 family phage protein